MREEYMRAAIELGREGIGRTNPNPLVGAVIVKNDCIIAKGYHEKYGGPHAEKNAINSCPESTEGGSLYVTLEPCSHHGKTPPCTEAIIESGIKKVYVGTLDPNPLVSGRGVSILRENGIEVTVGILEEECKKENEIFFHYITQKTPFVVMKYAMTTDGKITTATGESRWITGEKARERVHHDRNRLSGIMVGVNTIIADNPMLDCRLPNGNNPRPIICDTNLRAPLNSKVIDRGVELGTIVATCCEDESKVSEYTEKGVEIIRVEKKEGGIDLKKVMIALGEKGIDSILLEGGSTLNFSALKEGIVNRVQTYIAPKIFGGVDAKTPVGGRGIETISECVTLKNQKIIKIGEDILIESEVEQRCSQES